MWYNSGVVKRTSADPGGQSRNERKGNIMTIKQQTRQAKQSYTRYVRSSDTCLRDVYGRWSDAKQKAMMYCERFCDNLHGVNLKIISYNTAKFYAGFEFPDPKTGVLKFMYISPEYDESIEVTQEMLQA